MAASRQPDEPMPLFVDYLNDSGDAKKRALIDGKRLTRERIERMVREAMEPGPALLELRVPSSIRSIPEGTARTFLKMRRGGIPAHHIHLELDWRNSVEEQLARWVHEYDGDSDDRANRWYNEVRMVVEEDCHAAQRSSEEMAGREETYGRAMLGKLSERLRWRQESDKERLHGLNHELARGVAGILTQECRVWWSDPFEITEETLDQCRDLWARQYPDTRETLS